MKVEIIEAVTTLTTRIRVQGQDIAISSAWLDGATVKPRFHGQLQAKIDGRCYWKNEKHQVHRFDFVNAGYFYSQ